MRPNFAAQRRDADFKTINMVARAAAYLSSPAGALQRARADYPTDFELHDTLETRAVTVPHSNAVNTSFNETNVSDIAGVIGPLSAFSQVTARALAVNLDTPAAGVLVPHMVAAADSVSFVAPGAPIPVKNYSIGGPTLNHHKAAAIVVLTRECADHSSAEKLFRALLTENVGTSIDKLFLDANDTDGIRPAGLRHGVAATSSGGADAMIEDLTSLAAIVALKAGSLSNICYVASPDIAVRIALMLPNLKIPVFATGGLGTETIMAMATNCLAAAASPEIKFDVADETSLHFEDSSPAHISATGTPNVVSAPARSLFQIDAKALRLIFEVDWRWRTTGAIAWMENLTWGEAV